MTNVLYAYLVNFRPGFLSLGITDFRGWIIPGDGGYPVWSRMEQHPWPFPLDASNTPSSSCDNPKCHCQIPLPLLSWL